MKYAYIILPVFIPVSFAASISRKVSSEERLREHLAMFRQVFDDNGRLHAQSESARTDQKTIKDLLEAQLTKMNKKSDEASTIVLPMGAKPDKLPGTIPQKETNEAKEMKEDNIDSNPELTIMPYFPPQPAVPSPLVVDLTTPSPPEESSVITNSLSRTTNEGSDITEKNNSNLINVGNSTIAEIQKIHKLTELDNESDSNDDDSDDEVTEDKKISSALADGLNALLGNQSNKSSVFDIEELVDELEKTSSVSYALPTSTTSIAIATSHTSTSTETTSSVEQKVHETKSLTNSDDNSNNLVYDSKGPLLERKANMKAVLDMGRTIRTVPSEPSRNRRSQRSKSYVEPTENNTKPTTSFKKVHFKDIVEKGDTRKKGITDMRPDNEYLKSNNSETETKPKPKPSKESVSEIRRMYFESLERAEGEDLIVYFHRIYPELHHLLGKKTHDDDHADELIDRLLDVLLKSKVKSGKNLDKNEERKFWQKPDMKSEIKVRDETIPKDLTELIGPLELDRLDGFDEDLEYDLELDLSDDYEQGKINAKRLGTSPEYKNWKEKISDTLRKAKTNKFFQNPFNHNLTSEAANLAEVYPSVIGAVILALFLILL